MKITRWILLCFFAISISSASAITINNEKSDSIKTLEMISLYRQYVKQGNIPDAISSWRWVFLNAPEVREFTYTDGASKVVPFMIDNATTEADKKLLIDTLFMVYDQRITYFGKEGYVLGRKAYDMLRFIPTETDTILKTLQKSLELEGKEFEYFIISPFMQTMVIAYKKGERSKDQVLALYLALSKVIASNQASGDKYATKYAEAQTAIDGDLSAIIENCQEIVDLYGPALKKDPENIGLIDVIYNVMVGKNCYGESLFETVAVNKFKREQTADLAHNIALAFQSSGKFSEAVDYFQKSIELEKNNDTKATYYLELANLSYAKLRNYQQARSYAREALKLRPTWGLPLIIIGDVYLQAAATFSDPKEKWGAYWSAFDKYNAAKSLDSDVAETAQKKMNMVSAYFPDIDAGFFESLTNGASFSCSTWIGESTTVRIRN